MTSGKVYLVGAGPGDPGLLTVRALELLRKAHVIIYDQLVNPAILEECSAQAQKVYAGKKAGLHCISQQEINRVLIAYAERGYDVVRLKGGDPFVFGRGGEEAEVLSKAGIPFEIVPGVSSAVAVPAYAGIPLTHRELASSFAVVTGHEARKLHDRVNWAKLATAVDTLVILMGLGNLPVIVSKLLAHGRAPETAVAIVCSGTTTTQQAVFGNLLDIVEKSAALEAPALIVVGDVVSLSERLAWFYPALSSRKLYGCAGASESAGA
jgi:uroporphyrinogen III methyltransferase/synthase